MTVDFVHRLQAGNLVVELAPQAGGSIASFYSELPGERVDWLRPATEAALHARDPEGMASFPLIPFCNRIRNGRACFEGTHIVLPPNRGTSPHTIHGIAWKRPWTVVQEDARSVTMALESEREMWPYHFRATQSFQLFESGLQVTMTVENRDRTSMPLGMGHHPYLLRRKAAKLQVHVESMWLGDSEVMPLGLEAAPLVAQMRTGVPLRGIEADNNFVGWDRRASVTWPGIRDASQLHELIMTADAPMNFFVLYSPSDHDFFCIEPVSNCTDWLNLPGYAQGERGGTVLPPGETACTAFSLQPRVLG